MSDTADAGRDGAFPPNALPLDGAVHDAARSDAGRAADPSGDGLAEPGERPSDPPPILVQLTPQNYRAWSAGLYAIGGTLGSMFVLGLIRGEIDWTNPFMALMMLCGATYYAVLARRSPTQTLLRVDRSGISSETGIWNRDWSGVVMIWVGPQSGLRWPFGTNLHVYTSTGVHFAERASTHPSPVVIVPISGLRRRELCARLRSFTTAEVVDGSEVSRRDAARRLQAAH